MSSFYEKPTGVDSEVIKAGEDARREEWLETMCEAVPEELADQEDLQALYSGEVPVWLEPYGEAK